MRSLRNWRTVTLGHHKTPQAYLASIKARGSDVDMVAREIIDQIACAQEESKLPLVRGSGKDFGFKGNYLYPEFLKRARSYGYFPCPAEAALALAGQYEVLPGDLGGYIRFAMEPLVWIDVERSHSWHVLEVMLNGSTRPLDLSTARGGSGSVYDKYETWTLTTRKPPSV